MKQDFKKELEFEKKKNPYTLIVLIVLLLIAGTYAGYNAYKYNEAKTPNEKAIEKVKESGYLSVDTEMKKDTPKNVKDFVNSNKKKKGAYVLNEGKYTYIMISPGKATKNGKDFTISVDAPSYNKDKTIAKVVYRFVPFKNDVEDTETSYVLLKLNKMEVQMIESANELIL